jgi:hypothetical protein
MTEDIPAEATQHEKQICKETLIYNKPTTLVIWVLLINIACTALELRPTGKGAW